MFSFITGRLAGPILGTLLLAALATSGWQYFSGRATVTALRETVTRLETENRGLTADNATLRINQANLTASLAKQNQAVTELKAAGDLAAAKASAEQATASAAAAATRDRNVAAIRDAKPGDDRAASASALIRNTLARERTQ